MNLLERLRLYIVRKKISSNNPAAKALLIESHCISGIDSLRIGHGCRIGPGALINAAGGLVIGKNVIFAPNVVIWTQNHNFLYATKLPYDEKIIDRPVQIGDNSWFGEGVKIAPGVCIGEGVIAAIGSVILTDVPSFSVVRGNPATIHRTRSDILHYQGMDSDVDSYLAWKLKSKH